jgi:hypothetical protein
MAIKGLTPEEIRALPAAVNIPTAGRCFNLGRSKAYELARTGKFPVPVLPLGATFCATRASILACLGIEDVPAATEDHTANAA